MPKIIVNGEMMYDIDDTNEKADWPKHYTTDVEPDPDEFSRLARTYRNPNYSDQSVSSSSRLVRTFSWSLVKPEVIRALLEADSVADPITPDRLVAAANARFGRAGGGTRLTPHADVLRDIWLPDAHASTVKELAVLVQSIVVGEEKSSPISTKPLALAFLQRRKLAKNLKANLVTFFLAEHKESRSVPVRPRGTRERQGFRKLEGRAAERPPSWAHQIETREALDRHVAKSGNRGALVVLPTGAGKTDTLVEWLLDRVASNPSARVLWIVHQQELVDQAIDRFAACATGRPKGFSGRARAIHGAGSLVATLAEPELDVASVTIQTLSRAVTGKNRAKFTKFLERPTYVIIDEAHHAASPSYSQVLDAIEATTPLALIGLTATPWPTSIAAHHRLRERFPDDIVNIGPEELVARRILARPILHTEKTGLRLHLDSTERATAERADFSPQTLKNLDVAFRNAMVASAWRAQQDRWGKSLVFAVNIDHAEALLVALDSAGADVKAIHSRSESDRKTTLDWFRNATGHPVLVSVGMLNEGIDLPDATTAFLARPTTSRILLRQMIGRVLRGPESGGAAEAHVVWFQDGWENFGEVLDPSIVLPTAVRTRVDDDGVERTLSPLVDDQGGEIPLDVEAEIAVSFAPESLPMLDMDRDGEPDEGWVAVDPLLSSSRLMGYYDLAERRLPVFEHQDTAIRELIKTAISADLRGRPLLSWFDDTHPPYPSKSGLIRLVDISRELVSAPPFVSLDATIGPGVAADRLLAVGAITEPERHALMREVYETSLARVAYATLERFEEAVEQELRMRRHGRRCVEQPIPPSSAPRLRKRPQAPRELAPRWRATLQQARVLLPPEVRSRLADPPPIEVAWTRSVISSAWGEWTIRLRGKNAGRQTIRVNRILRTKVSIAPDTLLEYILYHELLHHLLPGEGHDAEFNELEALWPDRDACDLVLATFHERWETKPARYDDEVGN